MASESTAAASQNITHARLTFLDACRLGKLQLVQQLISDSSCDFTISDDDGNTGLHLAATHGHLTVVETLVNGNSLPSPEKNKDGKTPLHLLCTTGYAALMKRISHFDYTSQYMVALNGIANMVTLLLSKFECSVDVKTISDKVILHHACYCGDIELVRKLLSEKCSDPMARDSQGFTLLHIAAYGGSEEVATELINQYKCPVNCVESLYGRTPFYYACESGNVDLVRILISECGSNPMARDSEGNTPLHVAALCGREEVVRELVDRHKCPVDCVGALGRTVLHHACGSDNVDLVRILISEYGSDPMARDSEGNPVLCVAAFKGREEVVRELVDQYKCPVDCVGGLGRTVLHLACGSDNVHLVRILISEYGSDPMARDSEGNTALHVAAVGGREEVVRELVDRYKCPVDCVGALGRTVLHLACGSGNVYLVRVLISEYGSDPMARDSNGDTPLYVAALGGREEVVRELVDRYKCPVDCVGALGRTVLHHACDSTSDNVHLVRILISEYDSDPMARDSEGNTPLHVAAWNGREEVVRELVDRYKCPVDCVGGLGRSVLHLACGSGNVDLVRKLISEYGSDPMARDSEGDTPLHIAAERGYGKVVTSLVSEHAVDPMCVDDDGNTPLHIAALWNKVEIVKTLTNASQCFPCIRNNRYKTPFDLAVEERNDECINELASYAEAATVPVLPKVLVIGSKLSGKTTLVKAMKTICTGVPMDFAAYSCGIQLIHIASSIGEVAFFELPCEPTQAAVVEILTSTSSCSAIVVVNVSKGKQKVSEELGYWLSFLSYSCKLTQAPLRVTVVGSHADILAPRIDAQEMLGQVCNEVKQSFYRGNVKITGSIALKCDCWPILATVHTLKYHLEEMIALASADCPADISNGAKYLLKLLQKERKGKSMCQFSVVSDLVIAKHFYPDGEQTHVQLLIYLSELETHGFLHIVGDNNTLILNIISVLSTLSSGMREIALAHDTSEPLSVQEFGIITEENFATLFPNNIIDIPNISEYLSQLQLCVDIADPQYLFHAISRELLQSAVEQIGENSRCIFFPSCICTKSIHYNKWIKLRDNVFSKGFFLKVAESHQYLSIRFCHLLLLRVAFAFVFPSSSRMSQLGIECCAIWKSGIQWLAINGVEMFVELVEEQKGIVVAGRSDQAEEWKCESMLSAVMENILEVKSEFMRLDIYLIDPGDLKQDSIPESDTMHLFGITEIQNALVRKYESIPSVDRTTVLPISQISQMQKYTLWSKFYCCLCSNTFIIIQFFFFKAYISHWSQSQSWPT